LLKDGINICTSNSSSLSYFLVVGLSLNQRWIMIKILEVSHWFTSLIDFPKAITGGFELQNKSALSVAIWTDTSACQNIKFVLLWI
jgi:hypothetical protein